MLIKHIANILALPVTVTIILPLFLVIVFSYLPFWGLDLRAMIILLSIGLILIGSGSFLVFSTISLFIRQGEGTIAPWAPTKKLIKTGPYAYVRNPMIFGAFLVLIGETLLFGSIQLFIYTAVFILINLFYIPLIEEPKLTNRFGKEYTKYKRKVPRWIPTFRKIVQAYLS